MDFLGIRSLENPFPYMINGSEVYKTKCWAFMCQNLCWKIKSFLEVTWWYFKFKFKVPTFGMQAVCLSHSPFVVFFKFWYPSTPPIEPKIASMSLHRYSSHALSMIPFHFGYVSDNVFFVLRTSKSFQKPWKCDPEGEHRAGFFVLPLSFHFF